METFDFPISEETLRAITDMGYEKPTPIQELTITPMLEGKDLIGQAQTGTGKTAAFGIPLVEKIDASDKNVQAIILSPTRELAVQTAGEIQKLGKYRPGLRVLAVYGGQPIERQLRELQYGVQIIVGTPGRVMDHMNRGSLSLSRVKVAILDEADEMLDMGFRDDIENILSQTNEERQTALFSATMPFPILTLAQKYLKDPQMLKVENKQMTVEAIKQTYIQIRSFHKIELLARLLVRDNISRALVFMNTKMGVEEVVTALQNRGFAAAGLHGDMRQIERDAIMARFKQGTVGILIATDVAARGLDIDNVEAVFNYDIPLDVEYYVHRVGRTGRAGKEGRAYTFVVGRETARMWEYRKITKTAILTELPPSGEDIRKAEEQRLMEKTIELANGEQDEKLLESANKLLESAEPAKVIASLLKQLEEACGSKINPELDIKVPEPPRAPKSAAPAPVKRVGPYGKPYDNKGGRFGSKPEFGNRRDRRDGEHGRFGDKKFDRRDGDRRNFDKSENGRKFFDPRQGAKHSGDVRPANGKRIPREKTNKSGNESAE